MKLCANILYQTSTKLSQRWTFSTLIVEVSQERIILLAITGNNLITFLRHYKIDYSNNNERDFWYATLVPYGVVTLTTATPTRRGDNSQTVWFHWEKTLWVHSRSLKWLKQKTKLLHNRIENYSEIEISSDKSSYSKLLVKLNVDLDCSHKTVFVPLETNRETWIFISEVRNSKKTKPNIKILKNTSRDTTTDQNRIAK